MSGPFLFLLLCLAIAAAAICITFDWDEAKRISAFARERGIAMQLDGARLFIASAYTGISPAEYSAPFDTVYVSLYKGLAGLRGALLAADRATVAEAAVWRKRLGGAVGEAWPVAISALVGLDTLLPRMPEFREHAIAIAAAIDARISARTRQTSLIEVSLTRPDVSCPASPTS